MNWREWSYGLKFFKDVEVVSESFLIMALTTRADDIDLRFRTTTSATTLESHDHRKGLKYAMSLLRPSIGAGLLRAGAPAARKIVPCAMRFESKLAAPRPDEASLAKDEGRQHNQPDYTAIVDQASS